MSRNTSGILVQMCQKASILLDCGEETYEQLINHYKKQELSEELLKLRVIFITHIHSDHNLGILNLISERQRLLRERNEHSKLFLIIPFNVYNWYAEYNQIIEDLSLSCDVLFTQVLMKESFEEELSREKIKNEDSSRVGISSCNINNLEDRFFAEIAVFIRLFRVVIRPEN